MINKKEYFRILECVLLKLDDVSDLEINKIFYFWEMKKADEILKIIER